MGRPPKRKLSKKEIKGAITASVKAEQRGTFKPAERKEAAKKKVLIPEVVSVKDFADRAGLPVTQVITVLMRNGVLATINETIDFDTAAIVGDDLNLEIEKEVGEKAAKEEITAATTEDKKNLVPRPPVVTIMGHVDHGKTSLLDKIRETQVAATESGGITQHISAYQVKLEEAKHKNLKNRVITFIDTPGHAAFAAMREHGTSITDIVVLIVAATDGVMPQTMEVIESAKNNNVPIIVAINKIDVPDADVMKTKQQLSEHDLVPEEWGGKTVMVEVSAKTGQGVNDLLEMILLQADLLDLRANPKEKAVGVVIESEIKKGKGATAIVLIENGTLKRGDPIAMGSSYGKARILEDYSYQSVEEAGPSFPVRVSGLKSVPTFGDRLLAFDSEKEARANALKSQTAIGHISVATAKKIEKGEEEAKRAVELKIILKSDVVGSIDAIKKSLGEIKTEEGSIKLISEGVGAISESDITLAKATGAKVVGFRVKVLGAARHIAEKEGVEISIHKVIYELIDYIKSSLAELLPPLIIEEELGKGTVLAIFRDDRKGFVAGGKIASGRIALGDEIKFFQNDNEKYRAKISSLRKEKSEAKECTSGFECGFGLPAGAKVAVGDTFQTFKTIEQQRTIE